MWKSDFRMTHVEIVFKLLQFDKFFDRLAIFLKTCQIAERRHVRKADARRPRGRKIATNS